MPLPNLEDHAREEPDVAAFKSAYALLKSEERESIQILAALADDGSILSMVHLADAYRDGKVTTKNLLKAEEYYRRAASAGSLLAYYYLGRLMLGQERFREAMTYFNYASGKGYAPATHYLGRIYAIGRGVSEDVVRGEKLLARATKQGSVMAMMSLSSSLIVNRRSFHRVLFGVFLRIVALGAVLVVSVLEGRSSDRLR